MRLLAVMLSAYQNLRTKCTLCYKKRYLDIRLVDNSLEPPDNILVGLPAITNFHYLVVLARHLVPRETEATVA